VTDAASFTAALAAAQPGDVITLAAGTYGGQFGLHTSGTAGDPIVIRGASQAGAILDGADCTGCNVLEIYGSYVHVEDLTTQHGLHANDDGIHVEGTGHVIAHNTISGFGDAMKTEQDGAVSVDFVGNDVLWTYDNGIELDGSLRNTRALRNRFTNTFATLSFQPIFGGPAYAIRNVLVNVADEQFKLHARGTDPTVGAVIYHNTIVRGTRALQCSSANAPLYFTTANNLYVGPAALDPDGHAVRWD